MPASRNQTSRCWAQSAERKDYSGGVVDYSPVGQKRGSGKQGGAAPPSVDFFPTHNMRCLVRLPRSLAVPAVL
jgi:hypothetical protein